MNKQEALDKIEELKEFVKEYKEDTILYIDLDSDTSMWLESSSKTVNRLIERGFSINYSNSRYMFYTQQGNCYVYKVSK